MTIKEAAIKYSITEKELNRELKMLIDPRGTMSNELLIKILGEMSDRGIKGSCAAEKLSGLIRHKLKKRKCPECESGVKIKQGTRYNPIMSCDTNIFKCNECNHVSEQKIIKK